MTPSRILIKLGGASLQDESVLHKFAETLKQYRKFGFEVIVVHGGGPAINAELTRRGISWKFIDGQRVTTPEMMEVIEMVLSGNINRKLVRFLNSQGLLSLGFSGVDGQTLICEQASQELGLVGSVVKVQSAWIEELLKIPGSPIPVLAPLGVGPQVSGAICESLNINADWAASRLAQALKAHYLVFLTDQSGILDNQGQLISKISCSGLQDLVQSQVVTGGMLTKVNTILSALKGGVQAVRVMNGQESLKGLWSDPIGTWCLADSLIARERTTSATEFETRSA